jgi:hypothetical protein
VGEDPLERAGGARRRVFLTEGAVGRKPAVDQLAPPALDRAVDVGDQRPVELRLDAEAVREGGSTSRRASSASSSAAAW